MWSCLHDCVVPATLDFDPWFINFCFDQSAFAGLGFCHDLIRKGFVTKPSGFVSLRLSCVRSYKELKMNWRRPQEVCLMRKTMLWRPRLPTKGCR